MKSKIEVGNKFVIPKNTEFFLIGLQENVTLSRDVVINITHTTNSEFIFCNIQEITHMFCPDNTIRYGYYDKHNGEISISSKKLTTYNEKDF